MWSPLQHKWKITLNSDLACTRHSRLHLFNSCGDINYICYVTFSLKSCLLISPRNHFRHSCLVSFDGEEFVSVYSGYRRPSPLVSQNLHLVTHTTFPAWVQTWYRDIAGWFRVSLLIKSVFTVHIAGDLAKKNSIVYKVLQFSPVQPHLFAGVFHLYSTANRTEDDLPTEKPWFMVWWMNYRDWLRWWCYLTSCPGLWHRMW